MTIDERINKAEEDAKVAEIEAKWGIGSYFIDRTEALKYAKECRQLAEWLKELKRLREQTSWIPITERPPEDHDRYLITTDDGMVEMINYGYTNDLPDEIAFYQWDDEEWQCWKPKVTAWMPRPKPYKAESEDRNE